MKSNLKNKIVVTTGVILVTMGLTLLLSNYIEEKRDLVFSEVNLSILEEYEEETSQDAIDDNVSDTVEEEQPEQVTEQDYEYYIGTIEIPKVNISRGFYDKDSSLNNVDLNVMFLKESDYPDTKAGNVILAAHSGTRSNTYFTNLNKLVDGDLAYIKYKNITYTYKIVNIYDVDKTGTVKIYRDADKSTLTLITCNLSDNTKQTIYIAELIAKQ